MVTPIPSPDPPKSFGRIDRLPFGSRGFRVGEDEPVLRLSKRGPQHLVAGDVVCILEVDIDREHARGVLAQPVDQTRVHAPREHAAPVDVEPLQCPVVDGDDDDAWVCGSRTPCGEARVYRREFQPPHRVGVPDVQRETDREGREGDHGGRQDAVAPREPACAAAHLLEAAFRLGPPPVSYRRGKHVVVDLVPGHAAGLRSGDGAQDALALQMLEGRVEGRGVDVGELAQLA